VRKDVLWLCQQLGQLPAQGTGADHNGSQLERFAKPLRAAGVRRSISVWIPFILTLSADYPGRRAAQSAVRLQAAQSAGFERIKLNAVILKNVIMTR